MARLLGECETGARKHVGVKGWEAWEGSEERGEGAQGCERGRDGGDGRRDRMKGETMAAEGSGSRGDEGETKEG